MACSFTFKTKSALPGKFLIRADSVEEMRRRICLIVRKSVLRSCCEGKTRSSMANDVFGADLVPVSNVPLMFNRKSHWKYAGR